MPPKGGIGERIEDDARRLHLLDVAEDFRRGIAQLHLGRVEHGVLLARLEALLGGDELAHIDAFQGPTVRVGHRVYLLPRLGERHVEHLLAAAHALLEELERQRGLARARHALDEVQTVGRKSAAEDIVQACDAGGSAFRGCSHQGGFRISAGAPTRGRR
jgi:hypothetical protein